MGTRAGVEMECFSSLVLVGETEVDSLTCLVRQLTM